MKFEATICYAVIAISCLILILVAQPTKYQKSVLLQYEDEYKTCLQSVKHSQDCKIKSINFEIVEKNYETN